MGGGWYGTEFYFFVVGGMVCLQVLVVVSFLVL
jgi:hypothetical protein